MAQDIEKIVRLDPISYGFWHSFPWVASYISNGGGMRPAGLTIAHTVMETL